MTDKNGVASFDDVLISGTTPYTIEEVDTAIRYVVPANQTAPINWKEVTTRNFTNICLTAYIPFIRPQAGKVVS